MRQPKTKRNARSYAFLFITALLWGFAFAAQRLGGKSLGSFSFNGIRFMIGSASLLPLLLWQKRRDAARKDRLRAGGAGGETSVPRQERAGARTIVAAGAACGFVLFAGASLQQVGMVWTSAGKAAFLTGLYIILIPLAGLLSGKRPGRGLALGASLAFVGLYLLSVRGGFTVSLGDGLEIVGALFWAAHILLLGYFSTRVNPLLLAFIQNAACGILSLTVAVFAEGFDVATLAIAFSPGPAGALVPILYSGIASIGIAYTLQIFGQKGVEPGPAALILSLESVFAALGGALILGETMDARALTGAALMLAGMLAAQLIPPDFGKRETEPGEK